MSTFEKASMIFTNFQLVFLAQLVGNLVKGVGIEIKNPNQDFFFKLNKSRTCLKAK